MRLSAAVEGFFLEKQLDFSPSSVEKYGYTLSHFVEFTEDRAVDTILSGDVRRFLVHLKDAHNLSERSVFDNWAILSSFWSWVERELSLPHIIRGRVPAPNYPDTEVQPYTQDEVKQLLEAAGYMREYSTASGKTVRARRPTANRDTLLLLVLLDTGVRASELCDLTIADYDSKRGRLHIRRGKGGKQRFVIIGLKTRRALWRYLADRPEAKQGDPLFVTKTSRKLDRFLVYHMVSDFGDRAGVPRATVHRFRHTYAIEFLRAGGNVALLQELLGHEDVRTVMVYVQLAERDLDSASRFSPADNLKL